MDRSSVSAANREAWNVSADHHRHAPEWELLKARINDPAFSCLDQIATDVLSKIGVMGRAVAHVCCNNGAELISIKKLGAGECVGFDISAAFLAQARELAALAATDVGFVESDAADLPAAYHHRFNVVVITIGTLGWFPTLDRFFASVKKPPDTGRHAIHLRNAPGSGDVRTWHGGYYQGGARLFPNGALSHCRCHYI
jgi:SAM-dependent methyltransferase